MKETLICQICQFQIVLANSYNFQIIDQFNLELLQARDFVRIYTNQKCECPAQSCSLKGAQFLRV